MWRYFESDMKVFPWPLWMIVTTYALISVPLQEVVFRGMLIPRLEMVIKNRWLVIGISAALFGLAHALFGNVWLVMVTSLIGLFWSWLFVKYRNLLTIITSHAAVGNVFITLMNINL
jgi:membrane protease YdiL (CAAX protease family)